MNLEITSRNISNRIPPNYSTWQTIERTHLVCMDAINKGVDGDFVECGVAAGNNFGAMVLAAKNPGPRRLERMRHCWGFDSFEGIPWKSDKDDQQPGFSEPPKTMEGKSSGVSAHTIENVRADLKKWECGYGYDLIKGWFNDTLPKAEVEKISVLRLDGDLYESTLTSLVYMFPKLSVGGHLIIDDWSLAGCRIAIDEFFQMVGGLSANIELVYSNDDNPRYFKRI